MTRISALAWRQGAKRLGDVSVRLDITQKAGLRYALQRRREARAWETLRPRPRDLVYQEIWHDAAHALGADVTALSPSILDIARDGAVVRVSHQVVPLDSRDVPRLSVVTRAGDKPHVQRLLRSEGIPVPDSLVFSTSRPKPAIDFLRAGGGRPVFVKPQQGLGGWGVTGSVFHRSQLIRATLSAARYSSHALVEREVAGDIYRLLYLDGELLGATRRRVPTLVGDGRSTILELVHMENARRLAANGRAGLWLLRIDLDSLFALARAGVGLGSVVAEGVPVQVKGTTAENCLADNQTVRDLAPELVAQVAAAVRAVGIRLAGVDLATTDPSGPLAHGTGAIIEINENPGLSYHYLVADPSAATRVAVPILARCLQSAPAHETSHH